MPMLRYLVMQIGKKEDIIMNKPEVILIAAMSIDGFIAPSDKEKLPSTTWTSKEDWKFFTKKSKEIGTMILGSKTFETIKKALPERDMIVMTSDPNRYISYKDDNLVFTSDNAKEILSNLSEKGVKKVALCGGAHIYSLFLENKLVDRMYLTIEPFIFGEGVPLFKGQLNQEFVLISHEAINEQGSLLLEYSRN